MLHPDGHLIIRIYLSGSSCLITVRIGSAVMSEVILAAAMVMRNWMPVAFASIIFMALPWQWRCMQLAQQLPTLHLLAT